MTTTITTDHLGRFKELVTHITQSFEELAEVYVIGLTTDPDFREKIMQACPGISAGFLNRLALIHQGKLYKGLALIDHAPHFSRLPIAVQQAAVDHGVDMLTPSGEVRKAFPQTMSIDEIRQCITWERIRTPEEQRSYLDKRAIPKPKEELPAAIVEGPKNARYLNVLRPAKLSRLELLRYLADMGG